MTAGAVESATSASRSDWKLAAKQQEDEHHGQPEPEPQAGQHLAHRRDLPANFDLGAARRLAARSRAAAISRDTDPRSSPAMLAVRLTCRLML